MHFKNKDFEVFIARDGLEAMQILKKVKPEIVLLDIMMPNLDGYQTLKKIRENDSLTHTKIVFLTAKNKTSDIEKGIKLGADKYLVKPFSIKKIISEILELLTYEKHL